MGVPSTRSGRQASERTPAAIRISRRSMKLGKVRMSSHSTALPVRMTCPMRLVSSLSRVPTANSWPGSARKSKPAQAAGRATRAEGSISATIAMA